MFFDSPPRDNTNDSNNKHPHHQLKSSNTFFDEKFSKDLFASFADMKTPASANMSDEKFDNFNDPMMMCSTPTPTSTSSSNSNSSSTFFSAILDQHETTLDTNPFTADHDMNPFHTFSNHAQANNNTTTQNNSKTSDEPSFATRMRESMGKKQITEQLEKKIIHDVEKPKNKVEKKKRPKKFKPTNLLLQQKETDSQTMKPPATRQADDSGTYSQVNYEITSSGAFMIDDVRITEEGITNMPPSLCTQTQSPFKPQLLHVASPTRTKTRFMNDPGSENIITFKKKKQEKKVAPVSFQNLQSLKKLGEGASGVVDLVVDTTTGKQYARKIVKLAKDIQPKLILSEITALYNCVECPNILRFYNAYFVDSKIHMLLEYMDGNSLESLATVKVPENILELITCQILKGLYFLHFKRRIVHRDLKPANILFKLNGEVKISDMGLTGIFSKSQTQKTAAGKYGISNNHVFNTCQGTIVYMSPERIEEKEHSYNSDIWSLGITLVELALGYFPFKVGTYFDALEDIKNVENQNPLAGKGFSEVFQDFIYHCLRVNPDERYSSRDLLCHQFVYRHLKETEEEICAQIAKYIQQVQTQKLSMSSNEEK
ncbi:hypothetical protein C9374_004654 [Naegleria lovaniensis]|uniref:mitogen-activated protein kinase kinase n=1 Tax=Naegleria lovaniensis TaxID=51637 RepID=A0AA88GS36_NAELO|nr:uncharacterized protein C9374_004654 [Naegleria lovaniensis]KAG2383317.1 hypothetical protein C9374_004654 [Naegleria lovaniensis]